VRENILKVAVDLASTDGLEALTIGRLAGELKMSKSGLFAHFGSKEDLQLATIAVARRIFVTEVIEPAEAVPAGSRRLRTLIDGWLAYMEGGTFRGGCFFSAVSAEFDGRPGPVRDRIRESMREWIDLLEEQVREAQMRSEAFPDIDPGLLAFEVHAFVQEANWAWQLLREESAYARAREAIDRCLERAFSKPSALTPVASSAAAAPDEWQPGFD
jgi:AcrR family transcriptional regulator